MCDTIKAYGISHDLSDFTTTRAFELNGVSFVIWADSYYRSYSWHVSVNGKVMDEASSHDGFTRIDDLGIRKRGFDTIEEAFAHMAYHAKPAEDYRRLYDEQEDRGRRFAAYFEEHGTVPTGMADLDAILNGDDDE